MIPTRKVAEKLLKEVFNEKLKPIAIPSDSWEIIKKEFNDSLKQNKNLYNFIEELEEISDFNLEKTSKEIKNPENNEIEEIFEELVIYS